MKKTILFILFICVALANSFGQGEGNNWYFGSYAGLNFSTNPPNILNDGRLTTSEGCATVSSKAGVLLFYTDGTNVWDANHNFMPNGTGLFGDPSSTQSAVICPKPGTYNYGLKRFDGYYIVTIDNVSGPNGVRFSEVDMTLNGGTGDVLAGNKNTLLFGTTTVEGANVARHANGCDYWIIGKEVGNNTFKVYSITSAGVNLTPVISNVGGVTPAGWGNVKVSPNNQLIALANMSIGTQVFDFNNNTGVLTFKFSDNAGGYSLDFSADNNILYSAILNDPNIYQFDLTSPNNAAFQASRTIIGTTLNTIGYRMCALQMAPNGKIYAALQGLDYVGVINFPNILGAGCNYVDNGQSIAGINTFSGTSMSGRLGLPAFPSFFITQPITIVANNLCFQDLTQFQLSDTAEVDLVEWTIVDINLNLITQSTNFEPTFQFVDSGQYIVSTIVHYPCYIDSSIIDTITITYVSPVNLGADTLLCIGDSITLDAGTGYDYYSWSTGDTTQTSSVNATGQYLVQVLMQSEDSLCEKSDSIIITAFPIPSAEFTFTNECFGTPTVFTDVSNANGGTITNWEWDFDNDGTVDTTTQNAVFTFPGAGTFPVNLKASSAGGVCSHDTTINIVVNAMPASNFGFTDVCANDAAMFSDSSAISGGSIISYAWDFGNGPPAGTSAQQNPTYIFDSAGTFIVILTVTSDSGCVDVQGKSIEVFPLPSAAFTTSDVCLYDAAVFTNTSTLSSGSITSWQWNFGDTDTSLSEDPSHTYNTDGNYNVTLIVASDNNCSDTIVQPIEIYPIPVSAFGLGNVCLYDQAVFNDLSTVGSGNIVAWYWLFDDGNTSTVQNPSNSYSSDSTYDVSLIAFSNNNCVDTSTQSLTIYPVPNADLITNNVCLYDPEVFTDATTINSGSIIIYNWDFGDGVGISSDQNPSYSYVSDGIYSVTFTTTSDYNCIDDTIFDVEIFPVPEAGFLADTVSGCELLCVSFTDMTNISSGNINSWDWDFGDGNLSSVQNAQNCYSAIDEYTSRIATVTLIATSADGCSDTLINSPMIEIWPKPIADFTASPQPTTLLATMIDFTDQSLGNIVSWEWDFGDGDSLFAVGSAGANPTHLYTDTGTYIVIQIISNQYPCLDTFERAVVIYPGSIMHIPNAFTPNADGINDFFFPQGVAFDAVKFEMYIYDRWGDLVYKTTDAAIPWDGRANNGAKLVQADVYIWMVFATDMIGEKHKYVGHVTLIH